MRQVACITRFRTWSFGTILPALLLGVATPVLAGIDMRQERVEFGAGETSVTREARIRGREIVDYVLRAKSGQSMTVNLESDHRAAYFNVIAAGADTALFIGSIHGSRFEGKLPQDGDYTVRVYLMRSAARRGETARYTIGFRVDGLDQDTERTGPSPVGVNDRGSSGVLDCSASKPSYDDTCGCRVVRRQRGASIWIARPAGTGQTGYRVLHFESTALGEFATEDDARVSWERQGDIWWVNVDDQEYYRIPDAVIFGYDARGVIRCSTDEPTLDATCDFRVIRHATGAEIWIARTASGEGARHRVLRFSGVPEEHGNAVFTTNDGADLTWQRREDDWLVRVDGHEFYLIPDALIFGG